MLLLFSRKSREAERAAQTDADALVIVRGEAAYEEALRRHRAGLLSTERAPGARNPAHWFRVARIIAERSR